jgi:ribosomal protein L37AE/L43A
MPRKDATGPTGTRAGTGRRRAGESVATGIDGYCICPKCGEKTKHQRAEPCNLTKCSKCGETMVRSD